MNSKWGASQALHYGCAFTATLLTAVCFLIRLGQVKRRKNGLQRHRRFSAACVGLLALSYAVEGFVTATQEHALFRFQAHLVHMVVLLFAWGVVGTRSDHVLYEIWGISLATSVFEVALLVFFPFRRLGHLVPTFQLICQFVRILVLIVLLVQTGYAWLDGRKASGTEAWPILRGEHSGQATRESTYGTEPLIEHSGLEDVGSEVGEWEDSDTESEGNDRIKRLRAKRLQETGSWWAYLKEFSIFVPFLIPRKDRKVQSCYLITCLCLVGDRILNVLVPLQLGIVVNELSERKVPYRSLAIWLLLNLLSGESGLGLVQQLASIPIKQFSYRQISNAAFGHVMNLGMDFHSERDSAEVMRAVEQGWALTTVLETAVTGIAPIVFDVFIAVFLLYTKFNAYVALVVVIGSVAYMSLEVKTSNWNTGNRRQLTKAQRDEAKVMHQAVQGWQTVCYFNMFSFERHRFGKAVETQLQAERAWNQRRAFTDALLGLFVPITFACISCLVFLEISRGEASTGDFVFLIQYWDKLVFPLTYLSKQYRWLLSDLIDAERLLDLLKTKPTVTDRDTAKELGPVKGHVSFDHVYFSYDSRKSILEDVDFSALPGETIALVGETGAGKSTIIKLLFRFYDISSGQIKIDGQEIRDITLSSLRDTVGLVPQDPLLFNASIMENLRYARLSATDSEIEAACHAAAIHKKILTFPDGYDTIVGENGVKLSGGEIQRLAIARVFLRDPPILILDEATSAVDTATESEIQNVLVGLRERRTTFVIAHRLSTVAGADRILVMHDGRIVESGTHQSLLQQSGRYKNLWTAGAGGKEATHDSNSGGD